MLRCSAMSTCVSTHVRTFLSVPMDEFLAFSSEQLSCLDS